jgi:hypothetical protein
MLIQHTLIYLQNNSAISYQFLEGPESNEFQYIANQIIKIVKGE